MADERRISSVGDDRGNADDTRSASCPVNRPAADPEIARRLAELLRGIAGGDRDAFTQLYRSTHDRVFGLALRILRRPTAAEEITQEIYLYVWNDAARYDPALSSPIGWLMMLTHRRAVDRVRVDLGAVNVSGYPDGARPTSTVSLGGGDAFVTKLAANGASLVESDVIDRPAVRTGPAGAR